MMLRSIWRARFARISWPATARRSAWATVPVRIGRRPRSLAQRLGEQRVVGEALQELGVVVVEAEHEPHVVDTCLARRDDDDRAVGALRCLHLLEPSLDPDRRAETCRRRRARSAHRSPRPSAAARGSRITVVHRRGAARPSGARRHRYARRRLGESAWSGASREHVAPRRLREVRQPMLSRVASRVSLRSRERKLRLFHELLRPGPETTVVDVGVTDAPFGGGLDRQLLRSALPVARADHRRRRHRSRHGSRRRFRR